MTKFVIYRDACDHFAIARQGDAVFREEEHVGAFYSEFVESFQARSNANLKKILKETADAIRVGEEYDECRAEAARDSM